MCKLFDSNQEKLLNLVYELKEFNESEIKKILNIDGIIGDTLYIKEFLFSLCQSGLLSYNGFTYKLVPEEKQLNHLLLCSAGV